MSRDPDMEYSNHQTAQLQAVTLSTDELVSVGPPPGGGALPLVVQARQDDLDLVAWALAHGDRLESALAEHGALFFRDFQLTDTERFAAFATAVCDELFEDNGEHPHEVLAENVYTPVFYSPDKKLLWHNENSFNQRFPGKIIFCCVRPAEKGGETPVADSRLVYQRIDPEVRRRFEERGVCYQRNYGTGLGLGWREVFQTEERSVVEEYCRGNGFELEWKGEDGLRTTCVRPAVFEHSRTGEKSWFNQAQHWHLSCLDEATRESLTALFAEEDLPRACYYGDGSPIADEDMAHVLEVYEELETALPWSEGDVMLVDNVLAAHARNPYEGDRKLLVAMGEMLSYE